MAARPSAMLTAVVDLPTPPLPEATAMIEAMPGTPRLPEVCADAASGRAHGRAAARSGGGCGPRRYSRFHAAALLLGGQRHHRAGDARDRLDRALGGGPQRLHLLRPRGRHGDRKEDLGVGDENLRNQSERDDVAGEVRAVDRPEAFEDGLFGDAHALRIHAMPPSDRASRPPNQALVTARHRRA